MLRFVSVLMAGVSGIAVLSPAIAAPLAITSAPNVDTNAGSEDISFLGKTFVNKGLVGAGRVSAQALDFLGDTLGSFSGMSMIKSSWRRDVNTGQYSGQLYTLPDRGPNFNGFFSNYNGRLNKFDFTFSEYTGVSNLAQSTASQNQLTLTPSGGIEFSDFNGNKFTGLNPGSNTITQNGFTFGAPAVNAFPNNLGGGKISLDAEAVARLPDGSFYVSDEYQAGIFYFDKNGKQIGYIAATNSIAPRRNSATINFDASDPIAGTTGRRANQGLEGLTVSPDGKTLWVMLQSATVQDSTLSNDALRTVTHLIGYDISNNPTPTNPVAHFAMELPVFNRGNTNGTFTAGAANRTAAQSEILALNNTQFLVLSRDGNGKGNDPTNANGKGNDGRPMVFKSIMLIDTSGATNVAGTTRETDAGGKLTANGQPGVIDPLITPVQQTELVNILNTTQLNRFGLNTNTGSSTNATSLSEKWEGMSIMPTLEEDKPQDVFLFVSNDNDFLAQQCVVNGGITDGSTILSPTGVPPTNCNNSFDNDSMMLVYRLTLPTYVDSEYLNAMTEGAPLMMRAASMGALTISQGASADVAEELAAGRRSGDGASRSGVWVSSDVVFGDGVLMGTPTNNRTILQGSVGVDTLVAEGFRLGAALHIGHGAYKAQGFEVTSSAVAGSLYAGYFGKMFYAQVVGTWAPDVDLSDIKRPGAYGLTGVGSTSASTAAVDLEVGAPFEVSGFTLTPFAGINFSSASLDGYTETGAAGGNVTYPSYDVSQTTIRLGAEITGTVYGMTPSLRLAYNIVTDKAGAESVSLASASSASATQVVDIPTFGKSYFSADAGLQGKFTENTTWRVGYGARINDVGVSHSVSAGIRVGF